MYKETGQALEIEENILLDLAEICVMEAVNMIVRQ